MYLVCSLGIHPVLGEAWVEMSPRWGRRAWEAKEVGKYWAFRYEASEKGLN